MFGRKLTQLVLNSNKKICQTYQPRHGICGAYIGVRGIKTTTMANGAFNIQDEEDFTDRVLKSSTPVVVDFHAQWCGPCKLLGPRLESIIGGKGEKVHLAKVDIDEVSDLALEYDVSAVPSVLAIKDGKVVDKFVGLQEENRIEAFVNRLIGE